MFRRLQKHKWNMLLLQCCRNYCWLISQHLRRLAFCLCLLLWSDVNENTTTKQHFGVQRKQQWWIYFIMNPVLSTHTLLVWCAYKFCKARLSRGMKTAVKTKKSVPATPGVTVPANKLSKHPAACVTCFTMSQNNDPQPYLIQRLCGGFISFSFLEWHFKKLCLWLIASF